MILNRQPIIKDEKINFFNVYHVISYSFKKYAKYILLISILYFIYFSFFRTPFYSSQVSFYTNYDNNSSMSELSALGVFGGFSNEPSNLKFSLNNYLSSDKLFSQVVNNKYVINEEDKTLVDHWGPRYKRIFEINPFQTYKNINRKLALVSNLSVEDQKLLFAKEFLRDSIQHSEDKKSSLHTIKVIVRDQDPKLTEQIVISIFESILNYSNEITTIKAREKKEFISIRLNEIKAELTSSENKMELFLEKNKNSTSPNLMIQKDRIEREIFFYNQLYLNLSDQLEKVKIDEKDTTSSIFLLDEASLSSYKSGASIIERIITLFLFLLFTAISFELFSHKKEYFQ